MEAIHANYIHYLLVKQSHMNTQNFKGARKNNPPTDHERRAENTGKHRHNYHEALFSTQLLGKASNFPTIQIHLISHKDLLSLCSHKYF